MFRVELVQSRLKLVLHFLNLLLFEHELLFVKLQLLLLLLHALLLVRDLGDLLPLSEVFLLALHELIFRVLQVRLHDCQLVLRLLQLFLIGFQLFDDCAQLPDLRDKAVYLRLQV